MSTSNNCEIAPTGARGQPYQSRERESAAGGVSSGGQRALWAGPADKDAARSHSSCYV